MTNNAALAQVRLLPATAAPIATARTIAGDQSAELDENTDGSLVARLPGPLRERYL